MPTGEKTLRSLPPHAGHTVSGSSVNFWTFSVRSPQSVQAYWYVGTVSSFCGVSTRRGQLLDGSNGYGKLVIPSRGRATARTR
jgi:hypothetical protein